MLRRKWLGGDVFVGIAGDSTGVRQEAIGEVIPESLLCILDRFGLVMDEIERNGSIGKGKESCTFVVVVLFRSWERCSMKRS